MESNNKLYNLNLYSFSNPKELDTCNLTNYVNSEIHNIVYVPTIINKINQSAEKRTTPYQEHLLMSIDICIIN